LRGERFHQRERRVAVGDLRREQNAAGAVGQAVAAERHRIPQPGTDDRREVATERGGEQVQPRTQAEAGRDAEFGREAARETGDDGIELVDVGIVSAEREVEVHVAGDVLGLGIGIRELRSGRRGTNEHGSQQHKGRHCQRNLSKSGRCIAKKHSFPPRDVQRPVCIVARVGAVRGTQLKEIRRKTEIGCRQAAKSRCSEPAVLS
jgi:hypothetical protein